MFWSVPIETSAAAPDPQTWVFHRRTGIEGPTTVVEGVWNRAAPHIGQGDGARAPDTSSPPRTPTAMYDAVFMIPSLLSRCASAARIRTASLARRRAVRAVETGLEHLEIHE